MFINLAAIAGERERECVHQLAQGIEASFSKEDMNEHLEWGVIQLCSLLELFTTYKRADKLMPLNTFLYVWAE